MTLNILSMVSSVQKVYYPIFENFSVATLNNGLKDVYFKGKPKGAQTDLDYNTINVLFQSKRVLSSITTNAKRTNTRPQYKYSGFKVAVDETFIAPLIFFFCLLIFTPGAWKKKLLSFVLGTILILGFAYLIVYFKGLFMVSKSGVRDLAYRENDLNFFLILHYVFSAVTIVTVVLFTWILVSFRKSNLNQLFNHTEQVGEATNGK